MTVLRVDFLKSNPHHDEKGRFTSAGAAAGEHGEKELRDVLSDTADIETRSSVGELGRRVVSYLHDAAVDLAAKATHAIRGTRITAINPTTGGGIAIQTAHPLPGDAGHIAASLQIHPWDVQDERLRNAVSVAHRGLLASGRKIVPIEARGSIGFKNGEAP